MIVSLQPDADEGAVKKQLAARGQWVGATLKGPDGRATQLVLAPHSTSVTADELARIEGVASVAVPRSEHPRVDALGPEVQIAGVRLGGGAPPVVMSGPCAVESEARISSIAQALAGMGVAFLRGGAYKPRSSPYSFQGHGEQALRWLRKAADANRMRVVTEALGEADVPLVAEYADLVQIGSRNMQNFALLKAVGRAGRPVLLKRAMSATIEEWLLAGEYVLVHGAPSVVFCERGIRGFDDSTRHLLDLGAVALLAHAYKLPVIVDPSHATGRRELVLPLARAAVAAGAAGVMIEVHDAPADALSDGPQALMPEQLRELFPQDSGVAR
jgi:3-deoxy-7-phosphoheptulonate synthase